MARPYGGRHGRDVLVDGQPDDGSTAHGAKPAYIELGSLWENGYVEIFNGKFCDELLAREAFNTLAETLAAWLGDRPGVGIVARDRVSAHPKGSRDGALAAVQIADRWHMLRNLGDAVHGAVERHHAAMS